MADDTREKQAMASGDFLKDWPEMRAILPYLPFRLFLVNAEHETFTLSGHPMESPGAIHSSNCDYCEKLQSDCPIRATLKDRKPRHVTLPAHLFGEEGGMELDLVPLGPEQSDLLLVVQRELKYDEEELSRIQGHLERRIRQLDILNEVLAGLQQTRDLDRILQILLTGLTFGKGLEFNRAFFFERVDDEIIGRMAVGPLNGSEAGVIWQRGELHDISLKELIARLGREEGERPIQQMAESIRFRVDQTGPNLARALEDPGCSHLLLADKQGDGFCLLEETRSHESWLAPVMIPRNSGGVDLKGFLLVDNAITGRQPTSEHLDALLSCASHLGFALERARLNRELDSSLSSLQEAYRQLDQRQEQLVQAEKMAAVGRVTGNLMHEIKSPLMAIGGFARLLARETEEGSKNRQRADVMLKEARRIETVLEAMMDYSQPRVLHRERVDLAARLEAQAERYREEFVSRGVDVEIQIEPASYELDGDPLRLDQLIQAQLRNVLDLLDASNAPSRLLLRLEPTEEGALMIIADNGPGVLADVCDTLFEAFVSSGEGRLGLGLTNAREIASLHGGGMRLVQPGRLGGAEFQTSIRWRNHG